ncbi:MAG: hypothetical protein ABII25_08435 [bacterium]
MRRLLFLSMIILFLCPVISAEEIYYPGTKFISVAADLVETDLIWFGTNKCFLKYNKALDEWEIVSKDVKEVRVIAINPLEENFIWLGTMDGLNKYDRAKDTIEKIKDEDGILDIQINAILFDKITKKYIWFGSDFGLVRFDTEGNEWKTYASMEGLTAKKVNSIAQDANSGDYVLWVGTDDGLFKYSSKADFFLKIKPPKDFVEIKSISAVAIDEDYVLIGSANYGLVVYHKKKNSWQLYERKVNGENANDCILSILVDPFEPSSIWFGTRLHGVILFDKLNNIWQDFDQKNIIAQSLAIDVDNNIWVAASLCSGGGAFEYIKDKDRWLYTDPLVSIEDEFDLTWRKY